MSESNVLLKTLKTRLCPLYIAAFFQSFVLWYNIEKLFMHSIGFSNTGIGVMIAVYSIVMLVVETPSGILADRWSRKGVLILASLCLSLSALIGGLSHGVGIYLVAATTWGVFFACYSGMYDTIIYDSIIEETDRGGKLFDRLYGQLQVYESIALIIAGLLGGFLANKYWLRVAYYWSVPLGLVPIFALLVFNEPRLHKQQVAMPLQTQLQSVFQAILRKPAILPIVITMVLRTILIYMLYEFSQLWLLALHTPTQYYGIANAVLLASLGLGGFFADRLRLSRFFAMSITLSVTMLGCIGLILSRNIIGTVTSQLVLGTGLLAVYVIFSRLLHDSLESSLRAGASSATSTLGRCFIVPLALAFGFISQKFTIYKAAYILLVLAILMSVFVMVVASHNNHTGLEPN